VGVNAADDVVSSVVVRCLARPGGLGALREPKPYLMRSILNEARSRHASSKRVVLMPDREGSVEAVEPGNDVIELIAVLPVRQRAAAFLVFHEEYTPTEAAALMGCRPGTVRRYLHLARKKLGVELNG
jgi:RNA polymerase sigma factor (sigma-70 family)